MGGIIIGEVSGRFEEFFFGNNNGGNRNRHLVYKFRIKGKIETREVGA